jgi:Mn2+/Fe2+ NRAMP family transporter
MTRQQSDIDPSPGATGSRLAAFLESFGPGLLWAGTAIGVSHLVQSTRAGADAGFALAGVILFALILKYPFFEFGPRYAAATGESLLEGYRRIGFWALWLYFVVILLTVVITHAAIILFTAYLVLFAFGSTLPVPVAAGLLYTGCALLLWRGHFKALDFAIKGVLLLLAVSTLVAAGVVSGRVDLTTLNLLPVFGGDGIAFAFVLALAGWMPSDIAVSGHSSLWTLAKAGKGNRPSATNVRLDFLLSYVGTGILAFAFLILGATVMYNSGEAFSAAGTVFSTQLVELYAGSLGAWARPLVLIAAITAMFSTTLAIIDGYPRVIDRAVRVLRDPDPSRTADAAPGRVYWASMILVGIATVLTLSLFVGNLTQMVDFVTIVAFLTGPVLGFLNLRVMLMPTVPAEFRPGPAMKAYAVVGIVALAAVALVFLMGLLG